MGFQAHCQFAMKSGQRSNFLNPRCPDTLNAFKSSQQRFPALRPDPRHGFQP
jgi:hypothetical protein